MRRKAAYGNRGYFPTYTDGALIAAQLFGTARRDIPDLMEAIAMGEFAPLLVWLRERAHSRGSLLSTDELVEGAAGQPLGAASFERYLRERYLN
jgi:carboxypeptidase Taq